MMDIRKMTWEELVIELDKSKQQIEAAEQKQLDTTQHALNLLRGVTCERHKEILSQLSFAELCKETDGCHQCWKEHAEAVEREVDYYTNRLEAKQHIRVSDRENAKEALHVTREHVSAAEQQLTEYRARTTAMRAALQSLFQAHRPTKHYRSRGHIGGWRSEQCWCEACCQVYDVLTGSG